MGKNCPFQMGTPCSEIKCELWIAVARQCCFGIFGTVAVMIVAHSSSLLNKLKEATNAKTSNAVNQG